MPSCTFYVNESDYRKITKTLKQIGNVQDVLFKDNTDMMNPVLMLRSQERFDNTANYCYLSQTGKYYYINDCEYDNGVYLLHLHIDVLMTYQKAILAQPAILKRNANLKNAYLQDDKFNVYEYTNVRTIGYPENMGFSKNKQEFILAVVGNASSI